MFRCIIFRCFTKESYRMNICRLLRCTLLAWVSLAPSNAECPLCRDSSFYRFYSWLYWVRNHRASSSSSDRSGINYTFNSLPIHLSSLDRSAAPFWNAGSSFPRRYPHKCWGSVRQWAIHPYSASYGWGRTDCPRPYIPLSSSTGKSWCTGPCKELIKKVSIFLVVNVSFNNW